MNDDKITLKITACTSPAACIQILRKYDQSPMGDIRKRLQNKECVLSCGYTSHSGLKNVIACYESLTEIGAQVEIRELDDELTTIDFLYNLLHTYDEIAAEMDNAE